MAQSLDNSLSDTSTEVGIDCPERWLSIRLLWLFPNGKPAIGGATGAMYSVPQVGINNICVPRNCIVSIPVEEGQTRLDLYVYFTPEPGGAMNTETSLIYHWQLELDMPDADDRGPDGLQAAQCMLNNLGVKATAAHAGSGELDAGTRWALRWIQHYKGVTRDPAANPSEPADLPEPAPIVQLHDGLPGKETLKELEALYSNFPRQAEHPHEDNYLCNHTPEEVRAMAAPIETTEEPQPDEVRMVRGFIQWVFDRLEALTNTTETDVNGPENLTEPFYQLQYSVFQNNAFAQAARDRYLDEDKDYHTTGNSFCAVFTGEVVHSISMGCRKVRLNPDEQQEVYVYVAPADGGTTGYYHNTLALLQPVAWLQHNLYELGYHMHINDSSMPASAAVANRLTGVFDRYTGWSLRFFQAYAKDRTHSATESMADDRASFYIDRLASVALEAEDRYTGVEDDAEVENDAGVEENTEAEENAVAEDHVCGAYTQRTADVMRNWLIKSLRCPVVVFAASIGTGTLAAANVTRRRFLTRGGQIREMAGGAQNVWRHDHPPAPNEAHKLYAMDFSLKYSNNMVEHYPLGHRTRYQRVRQNGTELIPGGVAQDCWPEAELTPQNCLGRGGVDGIGLTAQELSQYKVIRAVSEVECHGYADSINSYDNVFLSLGPCHWTLGRSLIESNQKERGELGAFFNRLNTMPDNTWTETFSFLGLEPEAQIKTQAKWVAHVNFVRVDGTAPVTRFPASGTTISIAEYDFFRTWHISYAATQAGRFNLEYKRRMYAQATQRITDIRSLTITLNENSGFLPPRPNPYTAPRTRTLRLDQIFTSEKAWALLLRWHVYRPGHVAGSNLQASDRIRDILIAARAADVTAAQAAPRDRAAQTNLRLWSGNDGNWTNHHEARLIRAIRNYVGTRAGGVWTDLNDKMTYINRWQGRDARNKNFNLNLPLTNHALSENRNSFI